MSDRAPSRGDAHVPAEIAQRVRRAERAKSEPPGSRLASLRRR